MGLIMTTLIPFPTILAVILAAIYAEARGDGGA